MSKSEYPEGACWLYTAPQDSNLGAGATAKIWLERRDGAHEMWKWRYEHQGRAKTDWSPSRHQAVEECRLQFPKDRRVIFRRIKGFYDESLE